MVRNGITLLSEIDPVRRCERVADSVPLHERTLYLCPSPLYGYGLERLLSRLEAEASGSAILCIEADSELYELAHKHIKPSFAANGNFRITNICEPEKLCIFVRETWGARAFRRVEIVRLTGGWQLFPQLYNALYETLSREIATDWSNALTLTKLGRLYIRNALRNLPLLARYPSIEELSFGDSPVLVLGAGPSLDDHLDALDNCKNRSFKIVCVDSCLGALKDRNIVPDLTVILESQHWNLRDFIGCRDREINCAIDFSALPQSARMLAGQKYVFMTPWTNLKIFERLRAFGLLPAVCPPLGSVGLTAVEIARRLTTGEITCAGLDFSFTLDKYHARGTPGHREKLNTHNRFGGLLNTAVFDDGVIREGDRYTTPAMRGYRELFRREFENFSHREHRGTELTEKNLGGFVQSEIERLHELRDILVGKKAMERERLDILIGECDYLWAHFPDYAGGIKPDCGDVSFLNRVRLEIDFMIKILCYIQ